ncbi:ferredoxin [Streptomyces marincola]|uniref:ferredoxin n=1 Tax=Streptomyces marincola TaxID=2878388 RepID=UPI001CF386D0|nr:ferredoxin [Streptomyces marincola]UCM87045.1 (4Fe-4S)-binding protein [Streptomyces marincola]
MQVFADRDICVGAGQCVLAAEKVFDQDENDGLVLVLTQEPTGADQEGVRDAVDWCPSGAITLREG